LTQKKITLIGLCMTAGRPAIGKFTAVRLSPDMLAAIDARVPAGKRADFIREAVQAALDRRDAGADSVSILAALAARKAGRINS
jgi:Arc/MetJ-type ribon-helix-helix transcriptional regulator